MACVSSRSSYRACKQQKISDAGLWKSVLLVARDPQECCDSMKFNEGIVLGKGGLHKHHVSCSHSIVLLGVLIGHLAAASGEEFKRPFWYIPVSCAIRA